MKVIILTQKKISMILITLLVAITFLTMGSKHIVPSLVRTPGTYYMVRTSEKVVALTFDDGPDPVYTVRILDILSKKNVRATFFVLGQAVHSNPLILKRMLVDGHEIGNHGYTHAYNSNKYLEELSLTNQAIFAVTGIYPHYYRPPGGIVSKSLLEIAKKQRGIVTLWSVDSKDWLNPGPERIVNNVMQDVFPGAIILLHDGGDKRGQTVEALETLIDSLREEGYVFVTLSELKEQESNDQEIKTNTL